MGMAYEALVTPGASTRKYRPNRWDVVAIPLVIGVVMSLAFGAHQANVPFEMGQQLPLSLDPANLPNYALRSTLRMLAALVASLVFALAYATAAAKSHRLEQVLIPILDVLQSVPVLGYISFTVTAFIALFPHSLVGVECAAIFAIFTSEAWNMAFSVHQSLRTVPHDLHDASAVFGLTGWQKFWRLEVPFAVPGLIWNAMMSMSGGWFFVVASEAISVGDKQATLPGIGSYIAIAIQQENLRAIGCAILAMLVVILLYDQFLFRPLVAWADRFKFEDTPGQIVPKSWVFDILRRTRFLQWLFRPISMAWRWIRNLPLFGSYRPVAGLSAGPRSTLQLAIDVVWYAALVCVAAYIAWHVYAYLAPNVTRAELIEVFRFGLYTALRVVVLIVLAGLVWVPIGIFIGLRPRVAAFAQPIAQFLAAFPANLLFPVAVVLILKYSLDPNIFLLPLMILGTQWYLLFNVIAGASAFPQNLRDASDEFQVKGIMWWRKVILPGVYPYMLTGAITASGGCWNASIVSELVTWGNKTVKIDGLGAYIAQATSDGNYVKITLGVGVMSLYVALTNRLLWRPLYRMAEQKLRLG
jgi:NitT/TauT family transport system permease protein